MEEKEIMALLILKKNMPLHNDFDAYLFDIIEWGLGNGDKPNPENFGLPKNTEDAIL